MSITIAQKLALLRGAMQDGSQPPYNGFEFVSVKDLIAPRTPIEASMAARNSEAQNMRFLRAILTNEQVDALLGVKPGSAAAAAKVYADAGLGPVVWADYGNLHRGAGAPAPHNLTAFFPQRPSHDYNHPAAPRTMPHRAEYGDPLVTSPGVILANIYYDLVSEGAEPLDQRPDRAGLDSDKLAVA